MKVEQHPDKTFIGRVERGFDFLGYYLKPGIIRVAVKTIQRFALRITQLYEQGADCGRIGEYVRHWLKWVRSGIVCKRLILPYPLYVKRQHPHLAGECWRNGWYNIELINLVLAFLRLHRVLSVPVPCAD